MAEKIFKVPFAVAGDKIAIPVSDQPGGEVSQTTGWTPDYELENTEPRYRPVGRKEMNGTLYEVTEALGEVQQWGFAKWQSISGGWPLNARVQHNDVLYQSNRSSNENEPPHSSWDRIEFIVGGLVQETGDGTSRIMSQDAVTRALKARGASRTEWLAASITDKYASPTTYKDVIAYRNLGNSGPGTVGINLGEGLNFELTVTGNATIGAPSNATPGKEGEIIITVSGERTLSWHGNWRFLNFLPDISESGSEWVISYKVHTSSRIHATANLVVT